MFSKYRRRTSSNPPTRSVPHVPPSAAAALAASQAFLKDRASHASLSSAAAAAALRSHTSSPTPVGDIQTKRIARKASATSVGGSADGEGRQHLRRQSSSASMSERTFRSPSTKSASPVIQLGRNTPPVPILPTDTSKGRPQRRASSLGSSNRIAPPRSVTPEERGVSVDTRIARAPGRALRTPTLSQVPELERSSSRTSINFSYPISPKTSPPTSPARSGCSGWHTAPIVTNQEPKPSVAEVAKQSQVSKLLSMREASNNHLTLQPVAKNLAPQKQGRAFGVEDSHLASRGTNIEPTEGNLVDGRSEQSTPSDDIEPEFTGEDIGQVLQRRPSDSPNTPVVPSDIQVQPNHSEIDGFTHSPAGIVSPTTNTSRHFQMPSTGTLVRQPSTVMEVEEPEEHVATSANTGRKLAASPSSAPRDYAQPTSVHMMPAKALVVEENKIRSSNQLSTSLSVTKSTDAGKLRDRLSTEKEEESVRWERPQSLSPARSAHFAPVAVEFSSVVKHQPPPRSISPAKSAMKHSPSSSIRAASPGANLSTLQSRFAPSDASDTMSEDGSKPPQKKKKKKSIRVSFDEEAIIVGGKDSGESEKQHVPFISKDLRNSRWSPAMIEGDLDNALQPRPALPSFGSIGGRKRRDDHSHVAEKVTEIIPSSISTSVSTVTEPLESPIDHALKDAVSQGVDTKSNLKRLEGSERSIAKPSSPTDMLVDGIDYPLDSELNLDRNHVISTPDAQVPDDSGGDQTSTLPEKDCQARGNAAMSLNQAYEMVPLITLVPAPSVGTEASGEPFAMPGGFPEPTRTKVIEVPDEDHSAPASPLPTQLGIAQNSQETATSSLCEDSGDDEISIYSDAAEDLSDLEEGFASLDAMIESPIAPAASPPKNPPTTNIISVNHARSHLLLPASHPPVRPSMAAAVESNSDGVETYSSGPDKEQNQHPDRTLTASVPRAPPQLHDRENGPTRLGNRIKIPTSESKRPAGQEEGNRKSQNNAMRRSMHTQDAHPTSELASPQLMRTSTNNIELASSRHSGLPVPQKLSDPRGLLRKNRLPMVTAPASPQRPTTSQPSASKQRMPSSIRPGRMLTSGNDSDTSESSFKRRRSSTTPNKSGRYIMKKTMRDTSQPVSLRFSSPPTTGQSGPLGARSLSPTNSFLRTTMRDPSTPTLRGAPLIVKSSSFFGFSKKTKPIRLKPSPFKSRFADSSDEEDDRPVFQSRFIDSDDEDAVQLPVGLTPVRGIPRRPGDDDRESTDLSDEESSYEQPLPPVPFSNGIEKALSAHNSQAQGPALVAGSLRDSKWASPTGVLAKKDKKRGFFNLGKRRAQNEGLITSNIITARPHSPKLQRKTTPHHLRIASDAWPLPAKATNNDVMDSGRPLTLEGTAVRLSNPPRPALGTRNPTGGAVPLMDKHQKTENIIVPEQGGKRKRLPVLRRVFGRRG